MITYGLGLSGLAPQPPQVLWNLLQATFPMLSADSQFRTGSIKMAQPLGSLE